VKDVLDALGCADRHVRVREIAFEEIDALEVLEVAALAGDQTVDDSHAVPAANELLDKV
jgi:hypothetical protein